MKYLYPVDMEASTGLGMNSYKSVCTSKSLAEMRQYLHLKLRAEEVFFVHPTVFMVAILFLVVTSYSL